MSEQLKTIKQGIQKLKDMDHHLAAKDYENWLQRQTNFGGALLHLAQELQETLQRVEAEQNAKFLSQKI